MMKTSSAVAGIYLFKTAIGLGRGHVFNEGRGGGRGGCLLL